MSYENVIQDSQNMKHLTGLTSHQFKVLLDFLNDVRPLNKIRYWCYGKNSKQINSHKLPSQWSLEESETVKLHISYNSLFKRECENYRLYFSVQSELLCSNMLQSHNS